MNFCLQENVTCQSWRLPSSPLSPLNSHTRWTLLKLLKLSVLARERFYTSNRSTVQQHDDQNRIDSFLKTHFMNRIHLPPPSADGPDVTFNEDAANRRNAAINKHVPSISLKYGFKTYHRL